MTFIVTLCLTVLVCALRNVAADCMDRDFDALYMRPEGEQWQQRCDTCQCKSGKIECSGGPKCDIPYDSLLRHSCLEWTDDSCCCKRKGCKANGKQYDVNEWMPMDPSGCQVCQCQEGFRGECKAFLNCMPVA
ncbi:hypothetical protein LOTGIDRAFT_229900 [Lottia gigantea]|uniref:VWFC domain-containing protein n=1 Tax=Lottia gigantea TaxID=225164 RepID=V4AKP4_LOTGI|nr:hypothetical protein LOTGIDRAFT_229900 [Lottia gigantea]ESP04779.1 hypothetical protein LOTGIDRAFT_229900 [Lottia gigantea]